MGEATKQANTVSEITGVVPLNLARQTRIDPVKLDQNSLTHLLSSPRQIAAAEDDLEFRLGALCAAHGAADLDAMALSARRIRHLAMQIGLLDLRRAADNVLDCRTRGDATALAAVVARLDRLGRVALAQVSQLGRTVT